MKKQILKEASEAIALLFILADNGVLTLCQAYQMATVIQKEARNHGK